MVKMKNKEKLWKDFHITRLINLLFAFLLISIPIYIIIKEYNNGEYSLSGIIFLIFWIYFSNILLRTRLTYITNEGINIGNAPDDNYEKLKLKKIVFIYWKDIKEIKIVRHEVGRMGWVALKQFLVIKTKEGKAYKSFISNYKGFIKIMKKLNKSNLFSKDSKYQELIKSKK